MISEHIQMVSVQAFWGPHLVFVLQSLHQRYKEIRPTDNCSDCCPSILLNLESVNISFEGWGIFSVFLLLRMFLSLLNSFFSLPPISKAFSAVLVNCYSAALGMTGSTGHIGHSLEVLNPYAGAMLSENRENNCTYLSESCKLFPSSGRSAQLHKDNFPGCSCWNLLWV